MDLILENNISIENILNNSYTIKFYKEMYQNLIKYRKLKQLNKKNSYCENHHIRPKCLGGKDNKTNLINLSIKEHLLAHIILCKIYHKNYKLYCALWYMYNISKNKININKYENIKILYIKNKKGKTWDELYGKKRAKEIKIKRSITVKKNKSLSGPKNGMFGKRGKDCPFFGKNLSKKTKAKIRKTQINKFKNGIISAKGKNNGFYGKKHTEETKSKMSLSQKNRKKFKCKYCNRLFDPGNFSQYHGDKCKYKEKKHENIKN